MNINLRKQGIAVIGGLMMVSGLGLLLAQAPAEDGLAVAREIYTQLLKPSDDRACRFRYTIRTTSLQEGVPVEAVADIDYVGTKDRTAWVSQNYALYQDTTVSISVINDEKKLFIMPSSAKELQEQQRKIVEQARDALFADGKVVGWRKLDPTGSVKSNRELVIKPSEAVSRMTLIDTVTIYLNTIDRALQKVRLSYMDDAGVKAVEIEYGSMKWVNSPAEFNQPIMKMFFDEQNQLVPEYAGYTVQDMRDLRPRFPKRAQ